MCVKAQKVQTFIGQLTKIYRHGPGSQMEALANLGASFCEDLDPPVLFGFPVGAPLNQVPSFWVPSSKQVARATSIRLAHLFRILQVWRLVFSLFFFFWGFFSNGFLSVDGTGSKLGWHLRVFF